MMLVTTIYSQFLDYTFVKKVSWKPIILTKEEAFLNANPAIKINLKKTPFVIKDDTCAKY